MTLPFPLWVPIALPLVGALGVLATHRRKRLSHLLALAAATGTLALVSWGAGVALSQPAGLTPAVCENHSWMRPLGVDLKLCLDLLNAVPLAVVAAVITALIGSGGRPWENAVQLALASAATASFLSRDIVVFVAAGTICIGCLVALTAPRGAAGTHAAVRLGVSGLAAYLILLAAGLFAAAKAHSAGAPDGYSLAALEQVSLSEQVWLSEQVSLSPADQAVLLLLFLAGMALLMPLLPAHTWFIQVCATASISTVALVAGLLPLLGTYALMRFCLPTCAAALAEWAPLGSLWAGLTTAYGGALALLQSDPRRRLACACVAVNGLLLLGLFAATLEALQGSAFHGANQMLVRPPLFLLLAALSTNQTAARTATKGIAYRLSVVVGIAAVLAFVPVPGLSGFPGTLLILLGALAAQPASAALAVAGLICLTIAVLAEVPSCASRLSERASSPAVRRLAVFVPVVVVVAVAGLAPSWWTRHIAVPGARSLTQPPAAHQASDPLADPFGIAAEESASR